jgi:neutral ceramidase
MRTCFSRTIVLGLLLLGSTPPTHAGDLQVGVAAVDITPPAGLRMSGYFSERLNTGTLDPLWAKAIVLQQGDTKAAIVICDLIGISADIGQQARQAASDNSGIPVKQITLAATHSHTGPLYDGSLRKFLHDAAVAKHGKDPAEEFDFPAHLIKSVALALQLATEAVKPVTLKSAVGEEPRISFNRRFHMKDGSVRFNPGVKNPDIVRVAGPIDPEVGLLSFVDEKTGKPTACLTVFALHLDTVGGTRYSADYPHYLEAHLRRLFGSSFVSAFGTGTCGDINHIDVTDDKQFADRAATEAIGAKLAETVFATLDKTVEESPQLKVAQSTITVPAQEYTPEQIAAAAANMSKIGTRELSFLEQVEASKITDLSQFYPNKTVDLEVQVIRLSDKTAIVCVPGEVFVELGMAIKAASPFEQTIVIELCNSVPAYIPTRKAFAEGSYETVNSRIAPGGGEKMTEEAIRLLKSLDPKAN